MRSARFALLLSVLFLNIPVWAQQSQTPTTSSAAQTATTPSPAPKDPQAVNLLNQALTAAGGSGYYDSRRLYGNWKCDLPLNPEAQGTVTILGLGLDQIRVEASLPRGIHTSVVSAGTTTTKTQEGTVSQYPPPYPVPSSDAFPYQQPMFPGSLVFPHSQLVLALNSLRFSISYKGIVELDGNSVHDVQVQRLLPGKTQTDNMAEYRTTEFCIDVSTLHQIRYSGYRQVAGVWVPFAINEEMGGQKTRDIQLSQITFNRGLQDSAFAIQ